MCRPPALHQYGSIDEVAVHPLPVETVGGRLVDFHQQWQSITRDKWVLRTVKKGMLLDLHSAPPLSSEYFDSALTLQGQPAQLAACQTTVDSFIKKRIIEPVFSLSPGVCAAFFGVPGVALWTGCI